MNYESKGLGAIQSAAMENNTLEEIMDKLLLISDVSGVALVKADGSIITWHGKDGIEPAQCIDFMLDYILHAPKKNIAHYKYGMFTQRVIDHNGHRMLMSKVRSDIMLLLLLDRNAYLGLTMLDMEGGLREIDEVLDEFCT